MHPVDLSAVARTRDTEELRTSDEAMVDRGTITTTASGLKRRSRTLTAEERRVNVP